MVCAASPFIVLAARQVLMAKSARAHLPKVSTARSALGYQNHTGLCVLPATTRKSFSTANASKGQSALHSASCRLALVRWAGYALRCRDAFSSLLSTHFITRSCVDWNVKKCIFGFQAAVSYDGTAVAFLSRFTPVEKLHSCSRARGYVQSACSRRS
jgi:hypothetical protein